MSDRTSLLVHFRRLSNLLEDAIRSGPEGSLEGKHADEHPNFVHHACAFYLIGTLAYLEGEDGAYSWNRPGATATDFDAFVTGYPLPPGESFAAQGINSASMQALAVIRNAVAHGAGDLSRLGKLRCDPTTAAASIKDLGLPGVRLDGTAITLEAPFLEFTRLAGLAVRSYFGER